LKSNEQINDHIDMPVQKVTHAHDVCIFDNYPQFQEKVIRYCLATRAHYVVQIESC